jgi:hypothetical protein
MPVRKILVAVHVPSPEEGKCHSMMLVHVAYLSYLGMIVIDKLNIYEEIKNRLSSGIVFYFSVQNLSSSVSNLKS